MIHKLLFKGNVGSLVLILFLLVIPEKASSRNLNQKSPKTAPAVLTVRQWKEDLNELVGLLEKNHPNPYTRISKTDFYKMRESLEREIPRLSDRQISLRMMKLVSAIRDGHTTLHPSNQKIFKYWFPVSFYKFSDGFYIVSADQRYRKLIGQKVFKIGNYSAQTVWEKTSDLLGSDNEFGRNWNTFFLSSGDALAGLKLIDGAEEMPVGIIDKQGRTITEKISAIEIPYSLEHRFWGEMYPPGADKFEKNYLPGFEQISLPQWRRRSLNDQKHLPLHFRSRRAYWYTYLPEHKTIYLHMAHVTDAGRGGFGSFKEFYDHVFEVAENKKIEKLILDIRYNSGGDGSVLIPFVHKFIRSSLFEKPGKLFTLTGRKTFSAGVMLYDLMLKHTNTILVGEPAGAPRNSFGDAGSFRLKNSGFEVSISTVLWQLTNSADKSRFQPIDIPAVFSGTDYFSGDDPAVKYILSLKGRYKSIPEILLEKGGQVAKTEYEKRKTRYEKYVWWKAFPENTMRFAARGLIKNKRIEDGRIGFEILLERYPQSWRAWRDFGRAKLFYGDKAGALKCFKKGLEINPGYEYFRQQISQLEK